MDEAKLVGGAFGSWAKMTQRAVARRRRRSERKQEHEAAVRIQTLYRGHAARKLFGSGGGWNATEKMAAEELADGEAEAEQSWEVESPGAAAREHREQEAAAVAIQARVRGRNARKVRQARKEVAAAKKIQSRQRSRMDRRRTKKQAAAAGARSSKQRSPPKEGGKAKAPAKTKTMDPETSAGFWQCDTRSKTSAVVESEARSGSQRPDRPRSGKRRNNSVPKPKTLGASSPTPKVFKTDTARAAAASEHSPVTAAVKGVVGTTNDVSLDLEERAYEPSPTKMPSFSSLGMNLKQTRTSPVVQKDLFDGGTKLAERPVSTGALRDVAAASLAEDDDSEAGDLFEMPKTTEEEEDMMDSFEVVCPACTMVCDICSVKCVGCGGSLANAELADL